jgi:hypothetical protein
MGSEDLNEGNLEGRDLAVEEYTSQIELNLETDVNVGSVDSGRPPEGEATVRNLVKTGTLGVGQFLELHRLFKPACL